MRHRPLLLTDDARAAIKAAISLAKTKPIPRELLEEHDAPGPIIKLEDRDPALVRPESEHVYIPIGYRASFSMEDQPIGMCGHLSVSVDEKGMCPSVESVLLLAEEFQIVVASIWLEEFDPGEFAINLLGPLMTESLH